MRRRRRKGGSVVERRLAKLRDKEGYLSECAFDKEDGFRMVEYHSPYTLLAQGPTVYRMEQQMLERVIGTRIERTEEASGLVKMSSGVRTLEGVLDRKGGGMAGKSGEAR